MKSIEAISSQAVDLNKQSPVPPQKNEENFSSLLKNAIGELNQAQNISDQKTGDMVSGRVGDLHDVMITAQKAGIMLETSVQIQQKAIDAYNEVMRMQI